MPSGISAQHLPPAKAPGKRGKSFISWGRQEWEPSAHRHAAQTAGSANTEQTHSHPASPSRILSISSLTNRIPLVSYIRLSIPQTEGKKCLSKSTFLEASFISLPLNAQYCYQQQTTLAAKPAIRCGTAHARYKWAKTWSHSRRYTAGNFTCGPETPEIFPEGEASYQSGFSSVQQTLTYLTMLTLLLLKILYTPLPTPTWYKAQDTSPGLLPQGGRTAGISQSRSKR